MSVLVRSNIREMCQVVRVGGCIVKKEEPGEGSES